MHPVAIHLLAFARHGHPRARPGTAGGFRRRNEARSVAQKALLRTISSHGTGPSRHERPTLAFKSEGGGAVHDGPLAKDAGILPARWMGAGVLPLLSQAGQRYRRVSSRLSWWCGECTSSREAAPGYWQLKVGVSA